MRLRTTLISVLVLIALVLSGTIYVGFTLHKNDVRVQEQQAVEQTATVVADRIDTWFEATTETVKLWTANLNVSTGAPSQQPALETFLNRTAFDSAGVYTADGSLVSLAGSNLSSAERAALVNVNYSEKPFMQPPLSGRTYVGDVDRTLSGAYVVRVAAPIRDDDGTVRGVFSGNFEIGPTSLFGNITGISQRNEFVSIAAGDQLLYRGSRSMNGTISATATASRTGWIVTAHRPESIIADQLQVATAMQFGGVLVALLSIAVVGVWVSRTTFDRIQELHDALHALESGQYRTDLDLGSITEWQQISDRFNTVSGMLEQRDSQLRVLNRVLRHNLRNDMNVVTSHAERILAEEEVSDAVEADIEKIHSTAHRLINTSDHARTLYDDLLAKPKQAVGPVDVNSIVEERTADLAMQFPEATIETDLPSDAWALDSATLPIVVEEIARNALIHNDLSPSDRRVSISVRHPQLARDAVDASREIRIDVEDNGPGIPMVEEALLTNQLEETSIDHGSGLGVWLVNWLVDQIGGTVSVHTGVDRGTTVSIHVPAAEESPEADGAADTNGRGVNGSAHGEDSTPDGFSDPEDTNEES
ncbi:MULTISPECIES: sensor histidine kinase [unclassified Halorhabdus]|uniref:sensor histidine kinase n=1 Tax=unclassified Halorhabdus TaxID=2621901 RepID=UPI0023DCD5F3|nr:MULTISPECIES: sensor histidine kinase [unclassified Halorhabdus]WEL17501.1 Signal transduction histidine kinase, contains PAS domain [Halorhabdus sp. SVX81]WEL21380.1 Signal transduction histidine kinase, contains PAS domain [Halorhabdus sp. BNX81]